MNEGIFLRRLAYVGVSYAKSTNPVQQLLNMVWLQL